MRHRLAAFGLAIPALLLTPACRERTPPAGSGALETTPTASVARPAEFVSTSDVLTYPNGSVLTTDPKACRVRVLRGGTVAWDRELSGCGGLLDAAIAMDSTLYVRDQKSLSAFDPEGTLRWVAKLQDPPPARTLAAPTALTDSRVALASTPKMVAVYDQNGKVSWSFSPPSEEVIVLAPRGMQTEGLVLMTSRAVYYLSATGEVRWRAPGSDRITER